MCGNYGVWVPDPNNYGHGSCRPFRDQGNQCVGGDCVVRDSSSNTQCMEGCFDEKFIACMTPQPIMEDGKGKTLHSAAKGILLDAAKCTLLASSGCTKECQPEENQCLE